ncbi:MAG: alpha/beta hydrolase [Pseudomonadota bacterium]
MIAIVTRNPSVSETPASSLASNWSKLRHRLQGKWRESLFVTAFALSASPLASAQSLTPSTPPFNLGSDSAYFVKDVAYGPQARHKFDIFAPKASYKTKTKTPVAVFIHGGGFSSGSKEQAYSSSNQKMIIELLNRGVAFVSINYPLLESNEKEGLIKSLNGAKRAVQYLKYSSNSLNIAPDKIILMGSSAGASTSLWMAFHDDMANLNSSDPVEQQSTRVLGAVASETQSSMDMVRWEEVFAQYNFNVASVASAATKFYGISQLQELYSPRIVAYRQNVDLLGLMDSSDPEVWVANQSAPVTRPSNISILYHHPYHARALRDKAQQVGFKGNFYIPRLNIMPARQESMTQFVLRKVQL